MRGVLIVVLVLSFPILSEARPHQYPTKESIVKLLADTLYLEAGGESNEGKIGVACVIANRAGGYLNIPRTILARKQFSCWNDKSPLRYTAPNNAGYKYCLLVARDVVGGEFVVPDKFRGVTHYHELSVRPAWRNKLVMCAKVGRHLFYQKGGEKH